MYEYGIHLLLLTPLIFFFIKNENRSNQEKFINKELFFIPTTAPVTKNSTPEVQISINEALCRFYWYHRWRNIKQQTHNLTSTFEKQKLTVTSVFK